MYRDIPMKDRIDRVGELLAKAVYLYAKKEQEEKEKDNDKDDKNNKEAQT